MTNNPTIDGVPRDALSWAIKQLEEDGNLGCGYFDSLRAILDAPAVERKEGVQQYNATGQRVSVGCFVGREDFDTLQSTIARLEARIAELESGRGEPVAWKFKERVWATGLSDYVWRDQLEDGQPNEDEREIRDITPLFTAPPAPVAEKYQERVEFEKWIVGEWPTAPLRYVRDALPKDDPLHGTYCDGYLQRAWVGWQARACLDATAALNGVKS